MEQTISKNFFFHRITLGTKTCFLASDGTRIKFKAPDWWTFPRKKYDSNFINPDLFLS